MRKINYILKERFGDNKNFKSRYSDFYFFNGEYYGSFNEYIATNLCRFSLDDLI